MSFDIASYGGKPALVFDTYSEDREDSTVELANVRVFSSNPLEDDQFLNGVELDQAEPEPPAESATPGLHHQA